MIGYVWADEPRATAAAVVTGTDRAAAALAAAEEIASAFWAAPRRLPLWPPDRPLAAMLDAAERPPPRPVILADSGDNPTGGGVGDRADVLDGAPRSRLAGALLAGITDRPAVDACFAAGEGAILPLTVGGSLDPASAAVTAEARSPPPRRPRRSGRAPGRGEPRRRHHPRPRRPPAALSRPRRLSRLGLDPAARRLVVVKSGYLSPETRAARQPELDGADRRRGEPGYPPPRQPPSPPRHAPLRAEPRLPPRSRALRSLPALTPTARTPR